VRVVDNFSTGRKENLAPFAGRVEIVAGDVGDLEVARRATRGVEWVLHQAALPSVQRSLEDPPACHRANVDGTLAMLVAAREAGVRRFVYASSSSIYGNSPSLPKREEDVPAPASPYAASKLAGEAYALAFFRAFGLETVALRYFNVYGPRQDPESPYAAVVPRFVRAALSGKRPIVTGDGRQSRDFTFVDDAVEANLRACEAPEVAGQAFNVARGERTDLLRLLEILGEIVGRRLDPEFVPARAGEVRHSQADVARARERLGFSARVSIDEGLRRTVEWTLRA
jgi:nucleoside-diphosphate-sugar epimerase